MVAPKDFAWSFVDVAVVDATRVYLAAGHDESLAKNIPVSLITRWADAWSSQAVDIFAVSLCVVSYPERHVLTLGNEGTVVRWGAPAGFTQEPIDASDQGPQARGNAREISTIGKHAYAVGMGRWVYRCDGQANWARIDHGIRADFAAEPDAGLNAIDGFDEGEIYAVGWNGEIWGYDAQKWSRYDSPTNLALQKVVCGSDGVVYAVGQRGLIVRGRGSQWDVVEHDVTIEDFWGAAWFQGKLYIASANGLYALDGDTVSEVNTGKQTKTRADCFYRLSAAEDCIWSAGEKLLLRSSDGVVWEELPYS
jgi:hypothetical protein